MAVISRMTRSTGVLALAALFAAKNVHAQQTLCVQTFSMVVVDSSNEDLNGGFAVVVPNVLNPQVNTITFTNDPVAETGEFKLSADGRLMTLDGLIANTDSGVDFDYFFFDSPEELENNPALVPIICSVSANRLVCGAEGKEVIQYCDGNLSIGTTLNDIIPCAAVSLETDPLKLDVCDPSTTTITFDTTTSTSTALSTSTVLSTTEASGTTTVISTSTVGASSTGLGVPTDSSSTTASTIFNSSTNLGAPTSLSSSSASSASTNLANPTGLTTSTSTNSGVTTLTSTVLPVVTTTVFVATQTITQTLNGSATTITSTYPVWTTTCQVGATPIAPIYPGPTALPYMPASNSTQATYAPAHYAALPSAMIKCNKPAAPMPAYTVPAQSGGYGGNNGYNGYPNTSAPAPGGNYGAPAAPGSYTPGKNGNGGAPGSYGYGPAGNAPPSGTGAYVPYATGPVAYEGGAAAPMKMALSGVLAAAVMVACFML